MYKVTNKFKENQHEGHIYNVGDTYPVEGKRLVKSRAEQLLKVHPTYKVAFLEAVEVETPKTSDEKVKNTSEKGRKTSEKSDE